MESQTQGHGHGWHITSKAVGAREDLEHELIFAVKQRNIDVLTERIAKTSDLRSPLYAQHLSFEEVGELCANPEATAAIAAWLKAAGVSDLKPSSHGEYIRAKAPVATWNRLLKTRFHTFVRRDAGGIQAQGRVSGVVTRAEQYHLPAAMAEHVPYVLKASDLPTERRYGVRSHPPLAVGGFENSPAGGGVSGEVARHPDLFPGSVTPKLLETYYNISDHNATLGSMGVFESLGESINTNDLARFQTSFGLPELTYDNVVGGHMGPHIIGGFEAMLDVEVRRSYFFE
jgi:hypothetical protein